MRHQLAVKKIKWTVLSLYTRRYHVKAVVPCSIIRNNQIIYHEKKGADRKEQQNHNISSKENIVLRYR